MRSEGYLMPVACGARLRCSATRACSRAQLRERVVDFVSALALAVVALALAAVAWLAGFCKASGKTIEAPNLQQQRRSQNQSVPAVAATAV